MLQYGHCCCGSKVRLPHVSKCNQIRKGCGMGVHSCLELRLSDEPKQAGDPGPAPVHPVLPHSPHHAPPEEVPKAGGPVPGSVWGGVELGRHAGQFHLAEVAAAVPSPQLRSTKLRWDSPTVVLNWGEAYVKKWWSSALNQRRHPGLETNWFR